MDFVSEERTDMSMFIAPVAMSSAQIAHTNWMVYSGAGMSSTASATNLKDTMRCKIPITPAFGAVMNATSEGLISDPTFKGRGIIAIHIEGMHPQSVVSTSSMYRGRIRRRASRNIHIGTA